MVTQRGRLDEASLSIRCFIRQQLAPIELIIVHSGGNDHHLALTELVNSYNRSNIHIFQAPENNTLGGLRNLSLQHANAELICIWDADDYNHPARLKTQYELMREEGTDFCFMTDQLHLFTKNGFLFWNSRHSLQPPQDLIENTMLGRKKLMGRYPELERGEDTAIVEYIFKHEYSITRLTDMGWLYIYVFNNKNTWGFEHHSAIAQQQRLGMNDLLVREEILRKELLKYELQFDFVSMPHENGRIEILL
jgi:glycosyltransferase involved in cell wall biosynthesis